MNNVKRVILTEAFGIKGAGQVDGHVIRGAVLLGLHSRNGGRTYLPEAVKDAVSRGLYNTRIYVDHVTEGEERERDGVRTFRDLIGVSKDARFEDGKVRADIHVLESDPMGAKLLEAAKNPVFASAIGMSHDATGEVEDRNGIETVTRILDIESADAVTRPATTKGLFESQRAALHTALKGADTMRRVRFKQMLGDEELDKEGTVVGEMYQVRDDEGTIHTVAKEACSDMDGDHQDEEPMDEKAKAAEAARATEAEKQLRDENARLKEQVAKGDTSELVRRKTERMSEAMAELVRAEFKDKVAAETEVDAFIDRARRIVEAHQKDVGDDKERRAELATNGWLDRAGENNGPDDAELLSSAFPGLRTRS